MAAAPTSPLVKVEEYLNTSYDPDVEYVDGVLVERNAGAWEHSLVQSNLLFALRRKYPHLKVVAELRSSVTESRFRLPDISVLLSPPSTRHLADAAFLVVEVLSESDVMSAVVEKLKEYARKAFPTSGWSTRGCERCPFTSRRRWPRSKAIRDLRGIDTVYLTQQVCYDVLHRLNLAIPRGVIA